VPYHFDFEPTHKIARGRFEGRITDDELKKFYRESGAYFKKNKAHAGVSDLSGVTSFEISRETILQLASSDPALPDPKAIRVVIVPLPSLYGLARMFEITGERTRPNLHVVKTEQEAWAILGVWEPKFGPIE
jgi:hypothetical protein